MAKPLCGKRYFEAMGRSARDRGTVNSERALRAGMAPWARKAYWFGFLAQSLAPAASARR